MRKSPKPLFIDVLAYAKKKASKPAWLLTFSVVDLKRLELSTSGGG